MIKKEEQKYVWVTGDGVATLINDPVELWQTAQFNREKDKIYRLDEELETKVAVEIKNKGTVYHTTSKDEKMTHSFKAALDSAACALYETYNKQKKLKTTYKDKLMCFDQDLSLNIEEEAESSASVPTTLTDLGKR